MLTSLVKAGVYPDPYYGLNNLSIPESLCRTEWWYRIRFERPQETAGRHVWLRFDGINYRADVWLNGRKLGAVDGAFTRGIFDVTNLFAAENVLAVKIYPPHNPAFPTNSRKLRDGVPTEANYASTARPSTVPRVGTGFPASATGTSASGKA